MKTLRLKKDKMENYFNTMSNFLEGKEAIIDVVSLDIGDQIQADNVTLFGVVYDPKNDILEIALDGLDHIIHNPHDVYVVEGDAGIEAVGAIDNNGREQIIKFSDPIMLSDKS